MAGSKSSSSGRRQFYKGAWKYKNKREVAKHKQFVSDRWALRQYTATQRRQQEEAKSPGLAIKYDEDFTRFETLLQCPQQYIKVQNCSSNGIESADPDLSPSTGAAGLDTVLSDSNNGGYDSVPIDSFHDNKVARRSNCPATVAALQPCHDNVCSDVAAASRNGLTTRRSYQNGRRQGEQQEPLGAPVARAISSADVPATQKESFPPGGKKNGKLSLPVAALARFRKELGVAERAKKEEVARQLELRRMKELKAETLKRNKKIRRNESRLLRQKTAKGQPRMECVVKHLAAKLTKAARKAESIKT